MSEVVETVAPRRPAGQLRGISLVLLCLVSHCGVSLRDSAALTADSLAVVANAGGQAVLEGYCSAQMSAIGRSGSLEVGPDGGSRCVEGGDRAGTPASDEERAALVRTRARWRAVIDAHDAMRHAHDQLRRMLAAGEDGVPLALIGLTWAYGLVAQQASALGLDLPRPVGAGGAR